MKKFYSAVAALTLGVTLASAAPANAAGTDYRINSCTIGSNLKLTVSSWKNATGTKTYHYNIVGTSANPSLRVKDLDKRTTYYAKEGYATFADTTLDVWEGAWRHTNGISEVYCKVTV